MSKEIGKEWQEREFGEKNKFWKRRILNENSFKSEQECWKSEEQIKSTGSSPRLEQLHPIPSHPQKIQLSSHKTEPQLLSSSVSLPFPIDQVDSLKWNVCRKTQASLSSKKREKCNHNLQQMEKDFLQPFSFLGKGMKGRKNLIYESK